MAGVMGIADLEMIPIPQRNETLPRKCYVSLKLTRYRTGAFAWLCELRASCGSPSSSSVPVLPLEKPATGIAAQIAHHRLPGGHAKPSDVVVPYMR